MCFKYLQKIVSVLILCTFLSSCSLFKKDTSYIKTESFSSAMILLIESYNQAIPIIENIQKTKNIFTVEEWDSLLDVRAIIDLLIVKYQLIQKSNSKYNIHDMKAMWTLTKEVYSKAKVVVSAHISDFDTNTQILFKTFNFEAIDIADKVDTLLENPSDENLQKSLSLVVNTLTLAIKLTTLLI